MYYIYILQSLKDNKSYVGYTKDLKQRLRQHNEGENISTAKRRPLKLIYYEAYLDKADVLRRERFLKTGWGRNYIKRALENYFKTKI